MATQVAQRLSRRIGSWVLATLVLAGCSSEHSDIQRHAEKMDSLQATVAAVINAWLAGDVTGIYTAATLERTFTLVSLERAAVAATAQDLAVPAAGTVWRKGEELLRVVAALSDAVRREDRVSVRHQLGDLIGRTAQP
jgi:hypothetical protein